MKKLNEKYKKQIVGVSKRLLAFIMTAAMILSVFTWNVGGEVQKAEAAETKAMLSNPRIVPDSSMEAGQKVTWDCIYFGSYPQAEVITTAMSNSYTAIGSEYLEEGDLIVSDSIYQALSSATGWDSNGDITLNSTKYRRMKRSDATYAPSDPSGHYNWTDADTYHYFKYESIKWRVLSVDGNKAFLLADKALDDRPYNTTSTSITWEKSTIRSWLNGYGASANKAGTDYGNSNFIDTAFTAAEQSAIDTTTIENADNIGAGTEGGNNTADKIFLLSKSEVCTEAAKRYGFSASTATYDEARRSKSSTYAKAMGTCWAEGAVYGGNCKWWLRSPGHNPLNAALVRSNGYVGIDGTIVYLYGDGVRAALHLNLSSSNLWSYAGTVCSAGTVDENGANKPGGSTEPGGNETAQSKAEANIKNLLNNSSGIDADVKIPGPKLSFLGHEFNLFKLDAKFSLDFLKYGNVQFKYNADDNTGEVMIGVKEDITSDKDNAYWRSTYNEIKSLIEACGGNVDTNKLWNRFSNLRGKLKSFDAIAIYSVNGNAAGYMKFQLNESGEIVGIKEGGFTASLTGSGKVRTPLFWIVYSEIGLSIGADGKLTICANEKKELTTTGELGLSATPSIAIGADAVVADVQGGNCRDAWR